MKLKNYKNVRDSVNKLLKLDPNFPNAKLVKSIFII